MPRESDTERARRAVAHALGDFRYTPLPLTQEILCQRHAPGQQIVHRRDTDLTTEAHEERGTRQCRFLGEIGNRPRMRRPLVHEADGGRKTCVGKTTYQSRRRARTRGQSKRFDKQQFDQPGEHGLARGTLLA